MSCRAISAMRGLSAKPLDASMQAFELCLDTRAPCLFTSLPAAKRAPNCRDHHPRRGEWAGPRPAVDEKEWFRKIVIPAKLQPEFLLQLHRLNVTAIALLPGVDGLGRSMKELATLHAQVSPQSPGTKNP